MLVRSCCRNRNADFPAPVENCRTLETSKSLCPTQKWPCTLLTKLIPLSSARSLLFISLIIKILNHTKHTRDSEKKTTFFEFVSFIYLLMYIFLLNFLEFFYLYLTLARPHNTWCIRTQTKKTSSIIPT